MQFTAAVVFKPWECLSKHFLGQNVIDNMTNQIFVLSEIRNCGIQLYSRLLFQVSAIGHLIFVPGYQTKTVSKRVRIFDHFQSQDIIWAIYLAIDKTPTVFEGVEKKQCHY